MLFFKMSMIVSGVWSTSSRLIVNWFVVNSSACESLSKIFLLCRFGIPTLIWFVLHLFPVARKSQFLSWYLKLSSLSYVAWHLEHLQILRCWVLTWRRRLCLSVKVFSHCEQICSTGERSFPLLDFIVDVLPPWLRPSNEARSQLPLFIAVEKVYIDTAACRGGGGGGCNKR